MLVSVPLKITPSSESEKLVLHVPAMASSVSGSLLLLVLLHEVNEIEITVAKIARNTLNMGFIVVLIEVRGIW